MSVPNTERRRSARFLPAFSACCNTMSGGEGFVADISETGLSMVVATMPLLGVTLPVEVVSCGLVLAVNAQVAHATRLEAGEYFVGLRFTQPLPSDELESFIASAVESPV